MVSLVINVIAFDYVRVKYGAFWHLWRSHLVMNERLIIHDAYRLADEY